MRPIEVRPLNNIKLKRITRMEHVEEYRRWLGERRPYHALGIDTEGSGLSPEHDHVRLIQVGDDATGWAFDPDWVGVVRETVSTWDGEWIAHNTTYDDAMLRSSFGISLPRPRAHDTRLMYHILNPRGRVGLKPLGDEHISPVASTGQRMLSAAMKVNGWDWSTVPVDLPSYWQYGALDPVLTYRLFCKAAPEIFENFSKAYDIERSVAWVVNGMERYGTKIDRPFCDTASTGYETRLFELTQKVDATYGVRIGSNAQVIRYLQSEGIEFTKRTKSGSIALDKHVLAEIDHPLARSVKEYRSLDHVNDYLKGFMRFAGSDDIIHPSINSIGGSEKSADESGGMNAIVTARMSMNNPTLHNLPRVDDDDTDSPYNVVRDTIVPRDEGHTLVLCDYDQVEMRILAHLTQEPAMLDAFRSGEGDFFVTLAQAIYNDSTITKKDRRRGLTKNGSYAKAYGAGAEQFAQTVGITVEQARAFIGMYDQTFPRVREFQRSIEATARANNQRHGKPFVSSPLSSRRFFSDSMDKLYTLVNYMIQGAAAEIMKMALNEIDNAGAGKYLTLCVHDEVIADVPNEHVNDVVQIFRDVMNNDSLLTVPLTASVSTGKRWGRKVEAV